MLSIVLGWQKFFVELPQTVFQELLRYICNNLLFRITHFVIVLAFCSLTLWHAKVPEHLATIFHLNLIFYFFWIWRSVDFGLLHNCVLPGYSHTLPPSHLHPQKTYPTTWEPCKREINFKDWLSPLLSYIYIKNGLFRDVLKKL